MSSAPKGDTQQGWQPPSLASFTLVADGLFTPLPSTLRRDATLKENFSGVSLRTLLIISMLLPVTVWAKAKRQPAPPDAASIAALATANHFLRAWQTGDIETGLILLTDDARRGSSEDALRIYFANPLIRAFEVHRGRPLRPGKFSFPVVLLESSDPKRTRRRYSDVIVIDTGKSDWAVDKLP
jgi:hypothetical protein